MTSMDSGVETGNDSNDSSAAQHDNSGGIQVNSVATTTLCDPTATTSQTEEQKQQPEKEKETGKNFFLVRPPFSMDMELPISSLCPVFETLRPRENNQCSTGASTSSPLPLVPCSRIEPWKWCRWWCNTDGKPWPNFGLLDGTNTIYHTKMKSSQLKNSLRRYHRTGYKGYQDATNERKMRLAAATNNIELMTRLLNQGISPNNHDVQGRTPLHLASCRGYTEMVKLLLEHGADPNQQDCLGNAPLHLAVGTSKMSVVTLLLNAGTDILSWDNLGFNPVQLAQTKLEILQKYKGSAMEDVKKEVQCIVTILLLYLKRQKDACEEVEALSNFCSRLSLSNTTEQVRDDVRDLLSSIDSLRITS